MTILKTVTLSFILAISLPAVADFNTVEQAHEVALSDFRMPATGNGKLSFSECNGCVIQSYRVTNRTQYINNDKSMDLTEFRKLLTKARNRDKIMVVVLRHLESDTITSVSVSL